MFFILFATHTQTPSAAASSSCFSAPSSSSSSSSLSLSFLLSLLCLPRVATHTIDLSVVAYTFQSLPLSVEAGPAALCFVPCAFYLLTQCSPFYCFLRLPAYIYFD